MIKLYNRIIRFRNSELAERMLGHNLFISFMIKRAHRSPGFGWLAMPIDNTNRIESLTFKNTVKFSVMYLYINT